MKNPLIIASIVLIMLIFVSVIILSVQHKQAMNSVKGINYKEEKGFVRGLVEDITYWITG